MRHGRMMSGETILNLGKKVLAALFRPPRSKPVDWPDGKAFAFTIIDDTDEATIEKIRPIYNLLYTLGMRTTKTTWVWPTNEPGDPANSGDTLSEAIYRDFLIDLQARGFEIVFHGARGGSSKRSETLAALEKFKEVLGHYPKIHINHSMNRENLYWGKHKLDFLPLRILYRLFQRSEFSGHVADSEYFWGDVAQAEITYVKNFHFHEIDVMQVYPAVPYRDYKRPYVNYWFYSSDGSDLDTFSRLLAHDNLDRLEHKGGLCIVYTHFGRGFCRNGAVNERVVERLEDVVSRNGWYAPAGEILDFLRDRRRGEAGITGKNRIYLELRWAWEKLLKGQS